MSQFDNDSNVISAIDRIMQNVIDTAPKSKTNAVAKSIDQVNESLNDVSVHVLKHAVVRWATSPQMLCIFSTSELLFLKEAFEMELAYRRQERRA